MKVRKTEVEKTHFIEHEGVEYKRKVQQNFTEDDDGELVYWLKFNISSETDVAILSYWDFVKPYPKGIKCHVISMPYFQKLGEDEQILEDIYLKAIQ